MNISFFDDKPNIDELDFKMDFLNKFKTTDFESMPNLLFYGVPTSGKTTKIYALLASIFDKKVYDLKNISYEEDRKTITYKSSIYHIEINPLILGSNEKMFIQTFLKSYIETRNIGLDIPKIILIKNANMLSKQSQLSLRKLIEKNSLTSKFIFEISNISYFNEALVSRCLLIRVILPKIDDIKLCIKNFSNRHNINITDVTINNIITESNKISNIINLKKIFGFYRYHIITKNNFKYLYYDKFEEILNLIIAKKISFVNLQKIRDIINEMYINLISMDELVMFIFNNISDIYKDNLNFLYSLIDLTTYCDINLKKGNKDCLHLESYIVSIIDLIHNL